MAHAEPPAGPARAAAGAGVSARAQRVALPAALVSLRHRNFQLLWFGTVVSNSGDWMDQAALNWLVYQLSGSAIDLALLNLFRLAPIFVFTLIGGVAADRVERRRLMFTTQSVAMVLAVILGVLVSTGVVQIWMVLAIAVGRGIVLSFNQPARQSLISDLVPREDLKNAIALNSATLNLTRVLGPAIGGVLIATVGVAGAFYVNAATFLAVLYALALMRFPERLKRGHGSVAGEIAGGFAYLQSQPALRTMVLLALLPMVFGMPYQTMLTVVATDVLHVGGAEFGLLLSCTGVGAVAGSLWVASRARSVNLGRVMLAGLVMFGVALLLFALSRWFWLSVVVLIAVGAGQQVYTASNNALIQIRVDEVYRGRVVSTLLLNRGMVPLGTLIAGFGTAAFGVQPTMAFMACTLVVMALFATQFARGSGLLDDDGPDLAMARSPARPAPAAER